MYGSKALSVGWLVGWLMGGDCIEIVACNICYCWYYCIVL